MSQNFETFDFIKISVYNKKCIVNYQTTISYSCIYSPIKPNVENTRRQNRG